MRAVVRKLMSAGVVLPTRSQPHDGELITRFDDAHRLVARLCYSRDDPAPIMSNLIHAQIAEIRLHSMTLRGFERLDDGRLVAQAWDCEMTRRR